MALVLTVLTGPGEGTVVHAPEAERVTVGRAPASDLHVVDVTMSRRHAVVAAGPDGWWVEDQRSRNGVWVGGCRVERHRVADGDIVRFGKITEIRLTLESPGTAAAQPAQAVTPLDAAALVGKRIDAFQIGAPLPPCGPGVRVVARDEAVARDVALRVFGPSQAALPGFAEAFEREVRTATRLVHPRVVQVLDRGEHDGLAYSVEECVRGRSLEDLLSERRFLRPPDAAKVALHAIAGLEHTVALRVALPHLSSSAVLVNDAFDARIVRLADPLRPPHRPPDSQAGLVAPEVAEGRLVSEELALVYSVGALLYRMVCGLPPHDGRTLEEAAGRARRRPPADACRVNPKVSAELGRAVHDALDPDPHGRVPSLEGLRESLRRGL